MSHYTKTSQKVRATGGEGKTTQTGFGTRRRELLAQLAQEFPRGFFSPEEGIAILFATLDVAKRAIDAARIRLFMDKTGIYSLSQAFNQNGSISVPRPTQVLSRLNRGSTFPPILPPALSIKLQSLKVILNELQKESAEGTSSQLLLDRLATGSSLNW